MARAPRVVAITGASSGIGRATAVYFAQRGWDVGLIARTDAALQETARQVQQCGRRGCVAIADVSDASALDAAATRIERALGAIDVWVNDAGVSIYSRFADMSDADFRRVTDVTYLGVVNGTRAALRRMRPRNRGSIIVVASQISWRGMPLQSAYSGAKYALRGFVEAVRGELLHEKSRIHIGVVYPPGVNTPFFAHAGSHLQSGVPTAPPPMIQPEVVAEAIWRCAIDQVRDLKLTSGTILTKWANALLPSSLDWLMGQVGTSGQISNRPSARANRDITLYRPQSSRGRTRAEWRASPVSAQNWVARHPGLTLALAGGALALLLPRGMLRSAAGSAQQTAQRVSEQATHRAAETVP